MPTDRRLADVVEVGHAAPGFALADESGGERTLPVRGSPTVLVFYRGDW